MERVQLEFPAQATMHRHALTVRIGDMNYAHHLGHDALVSLLHEARIAALASLGMTEWDMAGYPSVIADLAVQYQGEASWPEALVAETAIPEPAADSKRLTIYHRLVREYDSQLIATARLTLMVVDPSSGRPVALPESVRATLMAKGDD